MNVTLDTSALYTTRAGTARYISGLIRGLETSPSDGITVQQLAWRVENFGYRQPSRAVKTIYRELFWAPVAAPATLRHTRPDLFHSPSSWFVSPPGNMPHVVTLHDLALIRHPRRFRPWFRHVGRQRLRRIVEAERVICVSRFTADEGIELLGLDPGRIEVIHHGIETGSVHLRPTGLPEEAFFLFVGSLEPGKNLQLLREAYDRSAGTLPPLAIAGARWEGVADEGRPPGNWHYLGHVTDEELNWLYANALALVFPTKYEGFGFPLLEAMAHGCPVIASRVASLPEIGGDDVFWSNLTASDYAAAMHELASDALARKEMGVKGKNRARRHTWQRCAQETAAVYKSLC